MQMGEKAHLRTMAADFSQCDGYDVGISQRAGASAGPQAARARRRRPAARIVAAVYVSPELYSLPVSQEFASLRPPLGGRTRLVLVSGLFSSVRQMYLSPNALTLLVERQEGHPVCLYTDL